MPAKEIRFFLDIPASTYREYYYGRIVDVIAQSRDGRTIRFPAGLLRHVVTPDGVRGEFVMEMDENNKFVAIRKVRNP